MGSSVLARSVAVAALAGLLFGFDTAVIAGTTHDLTRVYALSQAGLGITVSAALWGTLLGALTVGAPGDRYGSRDVLRVMAGLYVVSGLGCALAPSWPAFLLFRFIGGIGIGGSSVLAPVYISEIAPAKRRGALVGLFQINVVAGILLAYLSNALVGAAGLGALEWRWKLGVTAAPAALLLACLYAIPHSPRWLAAKGRAGEARKVLDRVAGARAGTEMAAIDADLRRERGRGNPRLSWRDHKRPILLAVGVAAFNQLAGINAILYYLNDIFAAAGFGKVSADTQAVIIGAVNLVFTALAMTVIDRVGRKPLLIGGSAVMALCLAGAALILSGHGAPALLLPVLCAFIAAFAFSQGAVIWVYIAEVFPNAVRARGQSVGCGVHWLMNALISFAFPLVAAHAKGAPFWLFAAAMAVQVAVVALVFPETRGRSLEELGDLSAPRRAAPLDTPA